MINAPQLPAAHWDDYSRVLFEAVDHLHFLSCPTGADPN